MWVFDRISTSECCSCSACSQICPRHAISMIYNDEGFMYPSKNGCACTDCGMCVGVCPIINESKLKYQGKSDVYAVQNKMTHELMKSSSGGVFSVLARYVLNKGGVVVGAAYEEDLYLRHVIIDNLEGVGKLRGSKYFASNCSDIYKNVRAVLNKGKLVCFSGTGCQVAALRSFLCKDYENLISVDIVCHGTPSRKAFLYFLSNFEKKRKVKVFDWKFRDKTIEGWQCASSSSSSLDAQGSVVHHYFDKIFHSYFKAFISGDLYRESCYHCPFACPERGGDITLADYWGIEKYHKEIDSFNGVSAILINSPKGRALFDDIKEELIYYESKFEWVTGINKNLLYPTSRPRRRDTIYDELSNNPQTVINSYVSTMQLFISFVKHQIKKNLRAHNDIYHLIYNLKRKIR